MIHPCFALLECSLNHSIAQHVYKFSKQLVLVLLINNHQTFSLSRLYSVTYLCKDAFHWVFLIRKSLMMAD